jgi:hypothetical protein
MQRGDRRDAAGMGEAILNMQSQLEKTLSAPRKITLDTPIEVSITVPSSPLVGLHTENKRLDVNAMMRQVT